MVFITMEMFVPPGYIPPDDGNNESENQHLVFALKDHFPMLLTGGQEELLLFRDHYFVDTDVGVVLKSGHALRGEYRLKLHINLEKPNDRIVLEFEEWLRKALRRWFDSKCVAPQHCSIEFAWKDQQ